MIFLTGGTGLLGNSILRELLQRGHSVRALCRRGTSRKPFEGLDVEVVEGDLSQPEAIHRFMTGCEVVIHSAAFIHLGWRRLSESRLANVEGTRHIVAACRAVGARMIHISTVDTLPAATSIDALIDESSLAGVDKIPCNYVFSKREADEVVNSAIRDHQLDAVLVHPGFMLGPYDWKPSSGRLMIGVAKAPLALAPSGGCSLCDARDVAAGIVNAVERGRAGESYIMAGENLLYRDLWKRILTTVGSRKKVLTPTRVLRMAGMVSDGIFRVLPIREGDINSASIAMGQLNHYYSSAKAQRDLDYQIRPSDQTLRDAWNWLSTQSFSR